MYLSTGKDVGNHQCRLELAAAAVAGTYRLFDAAVPNSDDMVPATPSNPAAKIKLSTAPMPSSANAVHCPTQLSRKTFPKK